MRPAARRVLALEQQMPTPPKKSAAMLELEVLLAHVTNAELDELEQVFRAAALLDLAEPLAVDRPRVAEILERADERRRQAGEPRP